MGTNQLHPPKTISQATTISVERRKRIKEQQTTPSQSSCLKPKNSSSTTTYKSSPGYTVQRSKASSSTTKSSCTSSCAKTFTALKCDSAFNRKKSSLSPPLQSPTRSDCSSREKSSSSSRETSIESDNSVVRCKVPAFDDAKDGFDS